MSGENCVETGYSLESVESVDSAGIWYETGKRAFDLLGSLVGLAVFLPLLVFVSVLIKLESRGSVLFVQERIGLGCRRFRILKFRTMRVDSERTGPGVTIGDRDPRVTRIGHFLRKYKIDELPQLVNVLLGDMSLVGPRPEVPTYVDLSDPRQRRVFSVRPGLTAPSSLALIDISERLASEKDPIGAYNRNVLPLKIRMNLKYIEDRSLALDFALVLVTMVKVFR